MLDSISILSYLKYSNFQLAEIKNILLQINNNSFLGIQEEYWTHIFLPICIPIIAFLFGKEFIKINDKIKKLRSLKEKQRFLFIWIEMIQEPMKVQSNIYKKYSLSLEKLNIGQLDVLNLHYDKLKLIDSVTLVSLIVTNRKGDENLKNKILFQFENTVDAIRRKNSSTIKLLKILNDTKKKTHAIWNKNLMDVRKTIQELHYVGHTLADNKKINEILKLYAAFSNKDSNGMKNTMENFVTEAGIICSDYINLYPQDEIIRRLINFLSPLKFAFESYENTCKSISKDFLEASIFLNKKALSLLKIKTEIANLRFKNASSII